MTYTVVEAKVNGMDVTPVSGSVTNTVADTLTKAEFTNERKTTELDITKEVKSSTADDTVFEFTITLTDPDAETEGTPVSGGPYPVTGAEEITEITFPSTGIAKIKVKSGNTAKITGLPAGVDYKVVETPVTGYVPTEFNDEGTLCLEPSKVLFTNTPRLVKY